MTSLQNSNAHISEKNSSCVKSLEVFASVPSFVRATVKASVPSFVRATVKSYCVLQLLRRQIPRNVTQAVSTQGGVSLCENKAKELLS